MEKKKNIIIVVGIMAILFVLFIIRVTPLKNADYEGKLKVTVSFYPLAFLAEQIGGEKVQVLNLTPAGAEPHEYEPTSRDIAEMENSSLLIVNGIGLEPWYENVKKNINPKKTSLIVASEGLGDMTVKDPHVWLSPLLMKTMAIKIEQALAKADPKNETYYNSNLQALGIKLEDLDAEYRRGLANCEQKNIITSHTAFKYLAQSYGLEQISIAGLSPESEPSPKAMGSIARFAKENNVKYIFFESLVSPKLSQTIAEEVGAKTLVLNPLEGLTEKEKEAGKNYLSIMRDNLANLQTALSCKI